MSDDYTQFDQPYDSFLDRQTSMTAGNVQPASYGSIGTGDAGVNPNGQPSSMLTQDSATVGDLWITDLIRSQNYAPKTNGFSIDGQTGYAEFANIFVNGQGTFKNIRIGNQILTINPGESIQSAVNVLAQNGGGILNLNSGTYLQTADIIIPQNIPLKMIGQNVTDTVIDFQNAGYGIVAAGANIYTTGTVNISSGVSVTGIGTSWLANLSAGNHIFLDNRWYVIATVTSNTGLILGEGYAGSPLIGATYRAGSIVSDFTFENITVTGSLSYGLYISDARLVTISNSLLIFNNVGMSCSYISLFDSDALIATSNTLQGVIFDSGNLVAAKHLETIANGATGVTTSNISVFNIEFSSSTANGGNGYYLTQCTDVYLEVQASFNSQNGVKIDASNDNVIMPNGLVSSNALDGITLEFANTNCRITASKLTGNGGYGVNIKDSSNNANIIATDVFDGNGSGAIHDLGIGTIISANSPDTLNDSYNSKAVVSKGTDQSLTTQTTLQNDNNLFFAVKANEEWVATFTLDAGAVLSTTGIKIAITTPAGAVQNITAALTPDATDVAGVNYRRTTASGTALDFTAASQPSTTSAGIVVSIWVLNGATPGNVQLQFAQSTSSGTAVTLRAGSFAIAQKVRAKTTTLFASIGEALTISEDIAIFCGFSRSVSDTLAVTENVKVNLINQPHVSDALTVSESVSRTQVHGVSVIDWVHPVDYRLNISDMPPTPSFNPIYGGTSASGQPNQGYGQSFVALSNSLSAIDLFTANGGSPADNLVVNITSSLGGASLGSTSVSSTLLNGFTFTKFTFSSPITLVNGTTYYVQVTRSGARDVSNFTVLYNTNPFTNQYIYGVTQILNNNVWTTGGLDLLARYYFDGIQTVSPPA